MPREIQKKFLVWRQYARDGNLEEGSVVRNAAGTYDVSYHVAEGGNRLPGHPLSTYTTVIATGLR